VKRLFLIVFAPVLPATLCAAEAPLGWPEVIALLWSRQPEKNKFALETKKRQLEAARWPAFADFHAQ
jgi:hypothetical protein